MNESGFVPRLVALVRKETRQMLRDRSNLAVGLVLPVVLILLFGYGLSFDVRNAPIAVVMEDNSPTARQAVRGFEGSSYLAPVWMTSMVDAERLMRAGKVSAIVQVPTDFSRRLSAGDAKIQLLLNGVDSVTAATVEGYVGGALANAAQKEADRAGGKPDARASVEVVQRMWFNESGNSTWYLVPGLLVLVLTLIGAFLTSLLIAREWERGTLEALFVTPVRPLEMLLAKLAPYLVIGTIDLVVCLLAGRLLFQVPMRGSLSAILVSSILYLAVSLLMGLFISGKTKNQFQASQLSLLISFMPALMLSGFVFDLRNVPAVIRVISQVLPATHFMGLVKTEFLAGDNWPLFARSCLILGAYALVLAFATTRTMRKSLE
ncbi:MAG TPA: ABC transporter permease [Thermomonas sp.]|nr:ABC transporter permease [Thermomonas sp.]